MRERAKTISHGVAAYWVLSVSETTARSPQTIIGS